MARQKNINLFIFMLLCFFDTKAQQQNVTLRLKWWHQFQFAGYYAAELKGFYKEEGLSVKLITGDAVNPITKEVSEGRADFGISGSDILVEYAKGTPLVALGAVFQHSPYVVMSMEASGIKTPSDLIGKKIMASENQGWVELKAMLLREGISLDQIKIVNHTWKNQDLISGKADAMTAYRSVEYFQLQAAGAKPAYLLPVNYGIDFYGDVLFTSKRMIDQSPKTVEKFKNASFKGWEYAMTHKEELVNYILTLPGVRERKVSREALLAESKAMDDLVLSQIVEPGHMNVGRWQHILDVHQQLGLVEKNVDINNFIYKKHTSNIDALKSISTFLLVAVVSLFLVIILYSLSVRKAVRRRTVELETQIKERISIQNELRKNEHQLNLIYNKVIDNIFVIEVSGTDTYTVTSVNQSFLETTGLSADQVIGKRVDEVVPEPSLTLIKSRYAEAIRTKKTVHWEEVTPYPTGIKTGNVSVTPIFDSLNNCVQLIGSVHDITERKHFEAEQDKRAQERELLINELTKNNKELKQFSFITSHNLRAPLTNLIAIADLIDTSKIADAPTQQLIEGFKESTHKLNETLNDLIKILVIRDSSNQSLTNVSFTQVFEQIISSIQSIVVNSKAKIETDFSACDSVLYNRLYMESIFLNMITNSIKYSDPSRTPQINIRSVKENDLIKLIFEDNGIGFDMATAKERLFGLYQRFHDHPDSKGIGLYLVHSQVVSLGGTIEADSTIGKGTTFTISFKNQTVDNSK